MTDDLDLGEEVRSRNPSGHGNPGLSSESKSAFRARTARERGVPVKERAVVRSNITRAHKAFEELKYEYPQYSHYDVDQYAKLETLCDRMTPLKYQITQLDNVIAKTFDAAHHSEGELEEENSTVDRYNEMIGTVLNAGRLVKSQQETETQVKLNSSLPSGAVIGAPGPVTTSTPFFGGGSSSFRLGGSGRYVGMKPPEVKLPSFSGDCQLWPSFIDRFMGMIDKDPRWQPCHKLEYLKSSCTGEASRIITPLQTTDANYVIALRMLRERYEDEWPAVGILFEAMFQFKALHGKSAKDLRRLREVFTQNTMSLTNLGHPVDGLVLVYLMGTTLEPESRELWEREVVMLPRTRLGKAGMPDEDILFRFVQQRARTLEHTPNASKGSQGAVAKKNFVTTKNASGETTAPAAPVLAAVGRTVPPAPKKYPPRKPEPCGHCQGPHRILACETF